MVLPALLLHEILVPAKRRRGNLVEKMDFGRERFHEVMQVQGVSSHRLFYLAPFLFEKSLDGNPYRNAVRIRPVFVFCNRSNPAIELKSIYVIFGFVESPGLFPYRCSGGERDP